MKKRITGLFVAGATIAAMLLGPSAPLANASSTLISDVNVITNMAESPDSVAGISATVDVAYRFLNCPSRAVDSVYVAKSLGNAGNNTEFGWGWDRGPSCAYSTNRHLFISKTNPSTGFTVLWTRDVPDGEYRITIYTPDPTNAIGLYSYFYDYNGVRYYPLVGGGVSTNINAAGRVYYNALTDDGWTWGVGHTSAEFETYGDQPAVEHYNIWGQCVHHVCGWAPINSTYSHDIVQWSFGFCPVGQYTSEVITFNAGSLGDGITYPWNAC